MGLLQGLLTELARSSNPDSAIFFFLTLTWTLDTYGPISNYMKNLRY